MTAWLWIVFLVLVLGLLALDLGVFHRKARVISAREALGWTGAWMAFSFAFNGVVYLAYEHHWLGIGLEVGHQLPGSAAALQFLTAYLIEKSLSLDNIFVIALVLSYFRVPLAYQHRVLFWGIMGALVLRGAMIWAGIAVISRFSWFIYVFAALLVFTALKLLFAREAAPELGKNRVLRLVKRLWPVTEEFHGQRFLVRIEGKWTLTPLLLALILVETSDVLFAVDSIPAVFAVTLDPFIVFTSNVCAILGLRSLYFALAVLMERMRYIKPCLAAILLFVGLKMLFSHQLELPSFVSLAVIVGILAVGTVASLFGAPRREPELSRAPNASE